MTLRIEQNLLDEVRRHAEQAYPLESCGVLAGAFGCGGQRSVERVVRCANAYPGARRRRYQIDPRELVRVQCEARQSGLAIVGFYHSHPDRWARYSNFDLAGAHWTGCSYVITAVKAGKAAASRSYCLRGGAEQVRFEEEKIDVRESRLPRILSAG